MILMDDTPSIVNGVEEGRLIFDNLKVHRVHFVVEHSGNCAVFDLHHDEIVAVAVNVLILCIDPVRIWSSISLAYETKEADIMDRPPRNAQNDRLVNFRLISFAYLQIGMIKP